MSRLHIGRWYKKSAHVLVFPSNKQVLGFFTTNSDLPGYYTLPSSYLSSTKVIYNALSLKWRLMLIYGLSSYKFNSIVYLKTCSCSHVQKLSFSFRP